MGRERDGNVSVHGNKNANATSGGVHPRATAAVFAANRGNGNGNAGKGGGGGSFVDTILKITVCVGGRQWSSVRFDNETLEEFAAAIRDARRPAFIDNDDSIQRLQLESSDGSEPEDLDMYFTLGDVITCKDDEQLLAIVKQLLAFVNSTQLTPPLRMPRAGTPKQRPDSESTPQLTNAIASNRNVSIAAPSSSPSPLAPSWSDSSANVQNSLSPQSEDGEGMDNEQPNGGSELVFPVKRRSKTRGVGTHYVKMSDLSALFHLNLDDAAKKLGVSQTTLKKACRTFGLKRWPGRKVRSLQSTIHGLLHEIVVGQGAGLEESTEAYMRSEVCKLQQELDELVHGTPAQHSPAIRTADLYKRLYSRGSRSKYHSAGRHDMITLDTGNPTI